jgi:hypothetical protein
MTTWVIDSPRTIETGPVRTVRTRLVAGSLSVVGTDDGHPRIEVAGIGARPLVVRDDHGVLDISFEEAGLPSWLSWMVWIGTGWKRQWADVSLALPRDTPIDLGGAASEVIVSGMKGSVRARSASGEITLTNLDGRIDAGTVSGSLTARDVGGDIRLKSVSGSITVADGRAHRLGAETTSGSVMADVAAPGSGELRFSSVSGSLLVRLPSDASVVTELRTTSGHVSSAFDLDKRSMPGMRSAGGRLGGGAAHLSATTVSGSIALLRRDGVPGDVDDDPVGGAPVGDDSAGAPVKDQPVEGGLS